MRSASQLRGVGTGISTRWSPGEARAPSATVRHGVGGSPSRRTHAEGPTVPSGCALQYAALWTDMTRSGWATTPVGSGMLFTNLGVFGLAEQLARLRRGHPCSSPWSFHLLSELSVRAHVACRTSRPTRRDISGSQREFTHVHPDCWRRENSSESIDR